LIAGIALISFLLIYNQYFNFELFTEIQRLLHMSIAVVVSLLVYFGVSFMLGIRVTDFR